jgi:hypothetical protein
MNVFELMKGRKVNVMTDARVVVQLEIDSVTVKHGSRDVGPSTPENDWWPPQETWVEYIVKFTNGYTKSYSSLGNIEII